MALIHTHHTVPTQSKLVFLSPSGTWQADVWASYASSLGKAHRSTLFVWQFSIETFMVNAHQPAEAPFTSQGSQDLVILWSCSGSEAVSFHFQTLISNTSDSSSSLFHVRCSSSPPFPISLKLMAISKISVSAYKYNKSSKIQLVDASQTAKSLVLLISKKGASCVSRLKLRKLLRLVPWATEFEHHVAQNLGKAHLPKSMKSQSFPVESYQFALSNKNQSIFVVA